MRITMVGLGKMGGNMVRRLRRNGIEVVGYDRSADAVKQLADESGMIAAVSVEDAVAKLSAPRILWLMLPSGEPTEQQIRALAPQLGKGDIIVDGGNSNYHDSQRRGAWLAERGIGFMDSGTSGGIWGLENGYCLMVGGTPEVAKTMTPILQALAPAPDRGWAHVGPVGSGHFVKMIHNGIEYGMMQAYAEGLDILRGAAKESLPAERRYDLDLAEITEVWRHGSVISSWLLDLTAAALAQNETLSNFSGVVQDSGEGRWTVNAAIEEAVPAEVLTAALYARFRSRQEHTFADKMLSAMRQKFGGHVEQKAPKT